MSCCSPKKWEEESKEKKNSSCCSSPQKDKKPKKITRQMTIEEILGMFPHQAQALAREISQAGLQCIGCHAAVWETLEGGMLGHGKTDAEIDELVERLNRLLEEEEEVDLNTIQITPRGAHKFLEILSKEGKQGWGMRFSEELAGCNGFEYVLDFSEKANEEDEIFASQGVEIHVKKALLPRLMGSRIDYRESLRESGFDVFNPNVGSSCGCGSSHNYNS